MSWSSPWCVINIFFIWIKINVSFSRYLGFGVFVKSTCDVIIGITEHNGSCTYAYFFWILSTIKIKFGQILVCCTTNISNIFLVQCWTLETHHDVTDLVNHGIVWNTKTWISWERNITFLWSKKIINLCLKWHILRSYRFVAEVTFNEDNMKADLEIQKFRQIDMLLVVSFSFYFHLQNRVHFVTFCHLMRTN